MVRQAEQWLRVEFEAIAPIGLASKMSVPLLVLHDTEDREILFEEGQALAARRPRALFHAVSKLGHRRLLRDAGCIEKAVQFLVQVDSA
jgi:hypothetical protein